MAGDMWLAIILSLASEGEDDDDVDEGAMAGWWGTW